MAERNPNTRGVNRVLIKLEKSIEDGNYYEAHQMYRTLFFRYSGQNKVDDCLTLLYGGANLLLDKEQSSSGSDLTLLYIQTLGKKSNWKNPEVEEQVEKLGNLIKKMKPAVVERQDVITKSIQWTVEVSKDHGTPLMHKIIGQILWTEGSYQQARKHILLSKEAVISARMLIAFNLSSGYKTEIDLIITQFILQQLCTLKESTISEVTFTTYTLNHPEIKQSVPPFELPLLNFLWFLLEMIRQRNIREAAYKKFLEIYKPSLDRDPDLHGYLQKIGTIFFNIAPAPQSNGPLGGLFGGIINQFIQGLNEDDGDTSDSSDSTTITIRLGVDPSEVD